jgi:hypothetical protein
MSNEVAVAKTVQETTRIAVKTGEAVLKKAWSILDTAGEKKTPSEVLSQSAINAIQGKAKGQG